MFERVSAAKSVEGCPTPPTTQSLPKARFFSGMPLTSLEGELDERRKGRGTVFGN
jgi:hypothetical protein